MWTSRQAFGCFADIGEDLVERHRVGARFAGLRREGAEVAGGRAHVGVVDVGVADEVRDVAVLRLAHVVGEAAEAEQVVRAVERDTVLEGEALAREDLLANRLERRVVHREGFEDRGTATAEAFIAAYFIGCRLLSPCVLAVYRTAGPIISAKDLKP